MQFCEQGSQSSGRRRDLEGNSRRHGVEEEGGKKMDQELGAKSRSRKRQPSALGSIGAKKKKE